jgi:hypothetical protein
MGSLFPVSAHYAKAIRFSFYNPFLLRPIICETCQCAPRQRALLRTLNCLFPKWRKLKIHESSPGWDKLSQRLVAKRSSYTASQWRPDLPSGTIVEEPRLVFEHVFHPDKAIAKIARLFEVGGGYIMSVRVVRRSYPSRIRARLRVTDLLKISFLQSFTATR